MFIKLHGCIIRSVASEMEVREESCRSEELTPLLLGGLNKSREAVVHGLAVLVGGVLFKTIRKK